MEYGTYGAQFEIKMISVSRNIAPGTRAKLQRIIQEEIQKSIKKNFSTESAAEKWAKLSPAYAKRKEKLYPGKKILSKSGELEMFVTSGTVTLNDDGENINVFYKMRIGKNEAKFLVPLTGAYVRQKRSQIAKKMYGWRGNNKWEKKQTEPAKGNAFIPARPWNYMREENMNKIAETWGDLIYEKILNGFDVEFNR